MQFSLFKRKQSAYYFIVTYYCLETTIFQILNLETMHMRMYMDQSMELAEFANTSKSLSAREPNQEGMHSTLVRVYDLMGNSVPRLLAGVLREY